MERNDEVKLASEVWNDIFSLTFVLSVDGDAAKGIADSDVTQNYERQISEPCGASLCVI